MMFFFGVCFAEQVVQAPIMSVQAKKEKQVVVALVTLGTVTKELQNVVDVVTQDLMFSGQCVVKNYSLDTLAHTTFVKNLYEQENIPLAFFVSMQDDEVSWRLYDTAQAVMVQGKAVRKKGPDLRRFAHQVADQMWPSFMGTMSSFASKIAWCQAHSVKKHGKTKEYRYIYIADYDGHNVQELVKNPTISIAPRWNNDLLAPLLYFSENTLSNVRLMMSNMYGNQMVMCSFEGINMLPAFSDDNKDVVVCLSKDGSGQLYHLDRHGKKLKMHRLTHNDGNNISPCFIGKNKIAFASDMKTEWPQIYTLDIKTGVTEQITDKGYCACPSYCAATNKLVYSKMVKGKMQLFVYDFKTKSHTQMTFGTDESKEEGCWSPCGTYIMFVANKHAKGRVARLNVLTKKIEYITPEGINCSYPAWSPVYAFFE